MSVYLSVYLYMYTFLYSFCSLFVVLVSFRTVTIYDPSLLFVVLVGFIESSHKPLRLRDARDQGSSGSRVRSRFMKGPVPGILSESRRGPHIRRTHEQELLKDSVRLPKVHQVPNL